HQRRAVLTDDLRRVAFPDHEPGRLRAVGQQRLTVLEQRPHIRLGDGEALLRLPDREATAGLVLALPRRAAKGAAVLLDLAVAVRAGADRAGQRSAVLPHELRGVAVDVRQLCRARALSPRLRR